MGRWGCDTVMVVGEALPSFTSRRLPTPHDGLCSSWGTSGSAGPAHIARQLFDVEQIFVLFAFLPSCDMETLAIIHQNQVGRKIGWKKEKQIVVVIEQVFENTIKCELPLHTT